MFYARGRGGGVGGGGPATCMSLPLGKYLRRALLGRRKHRAEEKEHWTRHRSSSSSADLVSSASSLSSASASWSAAAAGPVVRVVLWSGVEEVYAGAVLACTVIRNHPPGLCLAHPDVFRNPHGARLRPLEPLLPGHKFFLLPETTVRRLQRDIPEASVGAFPFYDDEPEREDEGETETSSTDMPSPSPSRSEGCCASARDYFVNRERWAERHLVERGLADAEERKNHSPSTSRSSRADGTTSKKRRRRRKTKLRCRYLLAPPPSWAKAWEPSLPSVQEEAAPSSPEHQTATTWPAQAQAPRTDHESPRAT